MYTIYGIPNCDTMKKAMSWLTSHKIACRFHDYKKEGISREKLNAWCDEAGWEVILNKKSTTWRELGREEQQKVITKATAVKVMLAQNSCIKRPVLETGKGIIVGFSEIAYQSLLP